MYRLVAGSTFVVVLAVSGCQGGGDTRASTSKAAPPKHQDEAPKLPSHVRVSFTGATIRPCKIDGKEWDGPGKVPTEVIADVAKALKASNPVAAIAELVVPSALGAISKPDPVGSAELTGAGKSGGTRQLPKIQDSFTPMWNATWQNVPLTSSLRLTVRLRDADLEFDDPIGTAELGYHDLVSALESEKVLAVNVSKQDNAQILLLSVEVIPQ